MKANNQNNNEIHAIPTQNQTPVEQTVEVLYQKMGDKWFAFSMVGEEVYVGSVSQDEIDGGKIPHGNA